MLFSSSVSCASVEIVFLFKVGKDLKIKDIKNQDLNSPQTEIFTGHCKICLLSVSISSTVILSEYLNMSIKIPNTLFEEVKLLNLFSSFFSFFCLTFL